MLIVLYFAPFCFGIVFFSSVLYYVWLFTKCCFGLLIDGITMWLYMQSFIFRLFMPKRTRIAWSMDTGWPSWSGSSMPGVDDAWGWLPGMTGCSWRVWCGWWRFCGGVRGTCCSVTSFPCTPHSRSFRWQHEVFREIVFLQTFQTKKPKKAFQNFPVMLCVAFFYVHVFIKSCVPCVRLP